MIRKIGVVVACIALAGCASNGGTFSNFSKLSDAEKKMKRQMTRKRQSSPIGPMRWKCVMLTWRGRATLSTAPAIES